MIKMLSGLPASGKSTRAKVFVSKYLDHKRVNKDLLREMLDFGEYSKNKEHLINEIEYLIAEHLANNGYTPVIDDTNLKDKDFQKWQELARKTGRNLQCIHINTPIITCIERDSKRENPVGERVIRDLSKFLKF